MDIHTLHSVPLGPNEYGHMQFDTTRSANRNRAKEQKKKERLERREEDAKKRKAERDDLINGFTGPHTH